MLLKKNYQLLNGIGKLPLTNFTLLKQERKLPTEPQLLPLPKDHFLTITVITESMLLVEALMLLVPHHLSHQLFHSVDVILKLIQSSQDHQKSLQFQILDTLLPQVTALFMDHAHLLLTALLEIM
jgi:hypothetical protein